MATAAVKFFLFELLWFITRGCANSINDRDAAPPCSLNGFVDGNGSCKCDAPWTGPLCERLEFLPVTFPQGYGQSPNLTTWGGNAIYSEKKYHLFVSAMTNGCGLDHFGRNSRIDHALADKITGPYVFRDVAVPTWSHNSAPLKLRDGSFAIFHIGGGNGPENGGVNCTAAPATLGLQQNRYQSPTRILALERQELSAAASSIHISRSLNGPWVPLLVNSLGKCINPAPYIHPTNASIFIVCNHVELKRSDTGIEGPWLDVTTIEVPKDASYEDPNLWMDSKLHFHLLYHAYRYNENPPHGHDCVNSTVSAHGYSLDGISWHFSPGQPYTTQIEMQSGDTITVATRERPFLFFNEQGKMTHLFTAVSGASSCPYGPPSGCVNCKWASWDYTLVSPLKVE